MFGPQTSLFATRYKCLKLTKQADDGYVAYGGNVNLECERFKLEELTNDQFKCLNQPGHTSFGEVKESRSRVPRRYLKEENIFEVVSLLQNIHAGYGDKCILSETAISEDTDAKTVQVDEGSRELLTINTHRGEHYRTAEVDAVISEHKQNSAAKMIAEFYPEILEAKLGNCTRAKAMLLPKSGAKPVFRPKRPVPYAAQATVNQELDRLEQQGVISKVEYSAWAVPIIVVKKANGKVRICADFSTGLNEALKLHQYPFPLPEEIFAALTGGRYSWQLDFADA
ncbi:unnamed protein product [Gongylonema pulchrum]|uniref:Transposon Ty3-G Gag-Pol polyprotein n=1 Tax=Gongylonema pulchrum TaxID=637853 RepID=A0A183EJG5_9BILA|nr:unnamed protein product [Gongylonema pulchrum]